VIPRGASAGARIPRIPHPPPPTSYPGLLMHFDGDLADACRGRTFVSDPAAAAWTDATAKFGSASFTAPATPVTYPVATDQHMADFAFGTGPFTIEFWVFRPTSTPVVGTVVEYRSGGTMVWAVRHTYNEANSTPQFYQAAGPVVQTASAYTTGVWHHIAVCSGDGAGTVRIYKDGTLLVTGYRGALVGAVSPATITIGSDLQGSSYMDDLRVLPVEVYTGSSFTPPAAPLAPFVTLG